MIYLDNAATTRRKPDEVIEAVVKAMRESGNAGRGAGEASLGASRVIYDTRDELANLFHAASPMQVAFASNSTEALNTAIGGLIDPGDHVITTMLEHNSVLRPLFRLEKSGTKLTILRPDAKGNVDPGQFEEAIRPDTKAIVCTHASNLTGNIQDLTAIGEICRMHELLFIVDASQTAGVIPVDMGKMHIDVLCFTGHKSLFGPQGTGGLAVRENLFIRPLKVGGSGIRTFDREHPKDMPTALEAGTLNSHAIAGFLAALRFRKRIGSDVIRKREEELARRFYEGVRDLPGVVIYGDFSGVERAPIVALNVGDDDSARISDYLLTHYGIETRAGGHCAPLMHEALGTIEQGAVRFSFSYFNTENEISAAIEAMREICGMA